MQSDSIRHVLVLMLENHSFDQMLGALWAEFPDLEGIDLSNLRHNKDVDGRDYAQAVTAATRVLKPTTWACGIVRTIGCPHR